MAINKVVYGNQTLIDLTDSTLTSSDELVEGVIAYDRSGNRLTGTADYMDKVDNPTADKILIDDGTGQAVDSGYSIEELPSSELASEKFFVKQSTKNATKVIKKLKGNTLVFNQLVRNGNFVDTNDWSTNSYISKSASNNIMNVTNIVGQDGDYFTTQNIPMVIGHKYYFHAEGKQLDTTSEQSLLLVFYGQASDNYVLRCDSTQNWFKANIIFTCVSNTYNFIRLRTQIANGTNQFKNVCMVDLTQMFGVGNEPTSVSEFTNLFPLPYYNYNAGSLLSFNGTGIKIENASQTESNTLSLPISTYFPTGMKEAGDVYDELTLSKAITRIGQITFDGTQNYVETSITSTQCRVLYSVPDIMPRTMEASVIDNGVISNYLMPSSNEKTWNGNAGIHRRANGNREIMVSLGVASGITSIESWNAYLSAHPLTVYYPLATPTETTTSLNAFYKVYEGGLEELQPVNTSVPTTTEVDMEVEYVYNKIVATSELINDGEGNGKFVTASELSNTTGTVTASTTNFTSSTFVLTKSGKVCTLFFTGTIKVTANGLITVGTIPTGYRPSAIVNFDVYTRTTTNNYEVMSLLDAVINTDGTIQIYAWSGNNGQIVRKQFTYICS